MEKTPFEQFILENLYNLWKEHGTSRVKHMQALIDEYGHQEENIRKPLKKLVSAGLVDTDAYCAWITEKGVAKMDFVVPSGKNTVTGEEKVPVSIGIDFLKNLEQAISKSELPALERETWLGGIKQMGQNPLLLKAVEAALEDTRQES